MWSKLGIAVAAIGLMASAYFQFVVLEDKWKAETAIELMEREADQKRAETGEDVAFYDMDGYPEARDDVSQVTDVAIGLLGIGAVAFLICLVSLIRSEEKDRLAQIGIGLSLLPLILGIINGTHMFS